MAFLSLLRRGKTKKVQLPLHTITVIESRALPFKLGQLVASVLGRKYFEWSPELPIPRIPSKVLSVSDSTPLPEDPAQRKLLGRIIDINEMLEERQWAPERLSQAQARAEFINSMLQKIRGVSGP